MAEFKDYFSQLVNRCESKPAATRNGNKPKFTVLAEFLGTYADFHLEEVPPKMLLRCNDATVSLVEREHPGKITVSEKMKWKTEGWKWMDFVIDGSVPVEIALKLIDESYGLACLRLDKNPDRHVQKAKQLELIARKVTPQIALEELISHHELSSRQSEVLQLKKQAILLRTTKMSASECKVGNSRIGGSPDLPDPGLWPKHRSGRPLSFLGQVNFAEVAAAARLPYLPDKGMLYVFSGYGWRVEGAADPHLPEMGEEADWSKLIYNGKTESIRNCPTPEGVTEYAAAKVNPLLIDTLPTNEMDPELVALGWSEQEARRVVDVSFAYQRVCSYLIGEHARHLVGGFADIVQCVPPEVSSGNLRLLLQIDSDKYSEMCWGDGGTLYFWIRPEKLREWNIDEVLSDYQSG